MAASRVLLSNPHATASPTTTRARARLRSAILSSPTAAAWPRSSARPIWLCCGSSPTWSARTACPPPSEGDEGGAGGGPRGRLRVGSTTSTYWLRPRGLGGAFNNCTRRGPLMSVEELSQGTQHNQGFQFSAIKSYYHNFNLQVIPDSLMTRLGVYQSHGASTTK